MESNKKNIILVVSILFLSLLVFVGGLSYAIWQANAEGTKQQINTGKVDFSYTESNVLNVVSNNAVSDVDGKVLNEYFSFKVGAKATGKITIGYYIYFTPVAGNSLDENKIKLYLSKVSSDAAPISSEIEIVSPSYVSNFIPFSTSTLAYMPASNDYFIYNDNLVFNNDDTYQNHYYRLRLWVDTNFETIIDDDGIHSIETPSGTFKMVVSISSHNGESTQITMP